MFKDFKVGTRLGAGFIILFTLFAVVVIFGFNRMSLIGDQTELLYRHPFTVTNAILRISVKIAMINRQLKDILLSDDATEIHILTESINRSEEEIFEDFDIISERFLGDKKLVEEELALVKEWKPIRDEIISLKHAGKSAEAVAAAKHKNNPHVEKLIRARDAIYKFAQNKAKVFMANSNEIEQSAFRSMYYMIAVIMALAVLFVVFLTRGITRPVAAIRDATLELSKGNLDADISVQSKDELGQLAANFRKMTADLRDAFSRIKNEEWVKSGLNNLYEKMRGEQDVDELGKNVITFMCGHLGASVGALYLSGDKKILSLAASYAYVERKNLSNEFKPGEGLVGQAALERHEIIVTSVPEDYVKITSGLGEASPRAVIVIPFIYEKNVLGVIELGLLEGYNAAHLEFIRQAADGVAVAFNSARARERTMELLEETQAQSEELQAQSEELRAINEELEEQTRALKESEGRLQSQQEELQQTNEELEERAELLEKQKAQINVKNEELKKAQAQIEEKAVDLELASRYKSEFLANMSHELRTPLNSILILSEHTAANKDGNLTPKQVESMRTVHSSGNDLLSLINDILDLSKIEAGRMDINPEDVAPADFVARMEQVFSPQAAKSGIELKTEIGQDFSTASIVTDRQKLEQIMKNLISNALKFTQKGSVTLRVGRPEAGVHPARSGLDAQNAAAFSVIDTGIGIPPEKHKLIFEAFHQGDGSTSRRFGGTGLGLSISRELAKLLGGEIQMESEVGRGSTFTLYLPMKISDAVRRESRRETSASAPPLNPPESGGQTTLLPVYGGGERAREKPAAVFTLPAKLEAGTSQAEGLTIDEVKDDRRNIKPGDRKLLIVEDDAAFAGILTDLARERNFKCIVAGDGKTGLQFADYYRPDAIILDVGLPGMDGFAVMQRLKDNPDTRGIPVHFMTASDKNIDARRMGAVGFVSKPISMDKLAETFSRIEEVITGGMKKLLVVTADKRQKEKLGDFLADKDITMTFAADAAGAYGIFKSANIDCVILDMDSFAGNGDSGGGGNSEGGNPLELLEMIKDDEALARIPVLIYAQRGLSEGQYAVLKRYAESIVVREVKSPERLFDEVALFLHLVEEQLPPEKKNILTALHDKEAIFKDKKILVVDDDVRNVFALTHILEDKGFKVIVGKNGREAVEQLEKNPDIDIALMDIMMPEMDGYESTRRIRLMARYKELPIIALTAKAMKGDRIKCIEAGASDYLAKPVDTDRLFSLLRVWLYR